MVFFVFLFVVLFLISFCKKNTHTHTHTILQLVVIMFKLTLECWMLETDVYFDLKFTSMYVMPQKQYYIARGNNRLCLL
jgi:hypothetical protein